MDRVETDQRINDDAQATILKPSDLRRSVIPAAALRPSAGCHRGSLSSGSALERLRALISRTGVLIALCAAQKAAISEVFCSVKLPCAGRRCRRHERVPWPMLRVMKDAAFLLDAPAASMGGLWAERRKCMAKVRDSPSTCSAVPMASAAAYAMAVLETNASMGPHRGGPHRAVDRPASSPA